MAASAQPPDSLPGGSAPFVLADAAATRALGGRLARRILTECRPDRAPLLLLQGDLGAGKTCLVQGLADGLGIREPVTSPTFALAQHYSGRLEQGPQAGRTTALVHLDLYRLEPAAADELLAQEEEEARNLGALLAVEWPERLSAPPAEAWWLELHLADPNAPEAGRLAELRST
ncbi:MAG: tRNA (adenosine(37)-N6)-threonylcarbamoyltransferase complex ATPase subunit type 1 TsaE [Synechococcaceae cyanobacterium]|nr:tRNA (adenosine(37)-N6)-threonylcarbamoyltransferase complex ATPase subunit type 1 TsaE [Synechococcaceae cyanobacterium]